MWLSRSTRRLGEHSSSCVLSPIFRLIQRSGSVSFRWLRSASSAFWLKKLMWNCFDVALIDFRPHVVLVLLGLRNSCLDPNKLLCFIVVLTWLSGKQMADSAFQSIQLVSLICIFIRYSAHKENDERNPMQMTSGNSANKGPRTMMMMMTCNQKPLYYPHKFQNA